MSRFFTLNLDIPKVEGIEDLFHGLMLCNNGAIVVAYKKPILVTGFNVGDQSFPQWMPIAVTPGAKVALDVMEPDRG